MRQLSRDTFARTLFVRETYDAPRLGKTCDWCGAEDGVDVPRLYRYGTARDDRPTSVDWHRGLFCSATCHRSYHG